ncbi:MAG: AI-2E family transporter [Lachnospiraceae bacterium]|nr:AI-2E family transporter [Lachnospiraceae bacterium]
MRIKTGFGKDLICFTMKKVDNEAEHEKKDGVSGLNRFVSNSKYFTISIYTVITVLACAVIVRAIFMWEATREAISSLVNWSFPYLLGIFLACLLYPLVVFVEQNLFKNLPENRKKLGRGLSILITYMMFLGVIVLVIGVIIPQVWQSILDMASVIPSWYQKSMQVLVKLNEDIPDFDFNFVTQKFQEFGNSFLSSSSLQDKLQSIFMTVVSTSVSVVSVFLNTIIALIVSIYLLVDLNRIGNASRRVLLSFVSEEMADKIGRVSGECYSIFSSFVSGKMLDSLIIGILCFIAMSILKLPYALVISVVVGVTNMIPYFGPFIGAVPGGFILLMVSPVKMLVYLLLILVLQQFDGLYLGPKILGDSTGLRPAWIIFSVSAGGAVCGVLGMFIGVPVVAVIGHLVNIWINSRLEKRNARQSRAEKNITD